MGKWQVTIGGSQSALEELAKSFNTDDLAILNTQDGFVIRSTAFAGREYEAVLECATEIINRLSGATRITLGETIPLSVGNPMDVNPDGSRTAYVRATSYVGFKATGLLTDASGQVTPTPLSSRLPLWLKAANQDERVATVLRQLKEPSDFRVLYFIHETIEHDMGSEEAIAKMGWADLPQQNRFTATANNYAASGDASRHANKGGKPMKASPMSLDEASEFIRNLARSWLEFKADQLSYT